MLGITDLTTYLIGTVAIVLLPGPNSLYVLSVAAGRGVRSGYAAACGVFAGDSILMFLGFIWIVAIALFFYARAMKAQGFCADMG